MRPILKILIPDSENSFVVRKDTGDSMKNSWHYHAECEVVYINNGCGTCLAGDYEGHFESGDVILLGSCIPHAFLFESKYLNNGDGQGEAIVAFFQPKILGDAFLSLPESIGIRNVLELCKRGLKTTGTTKNEIGGIVEEMQGASKGRKLISLLTILQLIAERNEYEILASHGYSFTTKKLNNDRLNSVIEYTYVNYRRQIAVEDVASLTSMTVHSFCRFFKEKTKKTYTRFLMEVRIGQACKLLIEDDMHPGEACYICGYNSISHFNHQFKVLKNQSPLEFKRNYDKTYGRFSIEKYVG
jgi:AraC-like DNA-binding protein